MAPIGRPHLPDGGAVAPISPRQCRPQRMWRRVIAEVPVGHCPCDSRSARAQTYPRKQRPAPAAHSVAAHSWTTPSMFALSFGPHGVPEGAT